MKGDIMNKIILYTTDCPRCLVIEKKMSAKNIPFEKEYDIDKMLNLGIMTAPALSIDGTILQFKEANDWINEQEDKE